MSVIVGAKYPVKDVKKEIVQMSNNTENQGGAQDEVQADSQSGGNTEDQTVNNTEDQSGAQDEVLGEKPDVKSGGKNRK